MAGLAKVNTAVVETLNTLAKTVSSPDTSQGQGSGAAFQSVSQSTAVAIQDATDYVRNVSAMGTATIGMAMAQLLSTLNPKYAEIIKTAQDTISTASKNMQEIGQVACGIAKDYPVRGGK